ncbi:MAG: hypothetical protein WA964_08665 [Ilumatobacter sp.]|uniref:hypothetical protein n=1 Tax=Ilumatobacter sp. TaxID=1967498 RepID=UPI003C783D68
MNEIQGWLVDLRELILVGAGVGLLVAVLAVGVVKRSMLAAFGTLLFGALLWWGLANSDWLRDKAGDDFDTAVAVSTIVESPISR